MPVGAEHTGQMQIIRVDNAAPPRGGGSPTSSAASAAAEHIVTCIAMWLMTVVEVLPASEDDMLRFLRQRAAGVVAESVAAVASIDNEDDAARASTASVTGPSSDAVIDDLARLSVLCGGGDNADGWAAVETLLHDNFGMCAGSRAAARWRRWTRRPRCRLFLDALRWLTLARAGIRGAVENKAVSAIAVVARPTSGRRSVGECASSAAVFGVRVSGGDTVSVTHQLDSWADRRWLRRAFTAFCGAGPARYPSAARAPTSCDVQLLVLTAARVDLPLLDSGLRLASPPVRRADRRLQRETQAGEEMLGMAASAPTASGPKADTAAAFRDISDEWTPAPSAYQARRSEKRIAAAIAAGDDGNEAAASGSLATPAAYWSFVTGVLDVHDAERLLRVSIGDPYDGGAVTAPRDTVTALWHPMSGADAVGALPTLKGPCTMPATTH
jgi:hypothetical protein